MKGWKEIRLGDLFSFCYGKMPESNNLVDNDKLGFPIYSGYRFVGFYNKYMYDEPKLIVVARGVGGTGDVKIAPPKTWITNLSIIFNSKSNISDIRYLLYFFKGYNLRFLDTGSAQSQITSGDLQRLKIPLPPLPIQKKIAAILSAYGDLIENNNRRIAILEKMAEELYREWFVRLRFPGHEKVKIIKGVPDGWALKPFSELVIKNPPLKAETGLLKPYVGMDALSMTSMIFISDEQRLDNNGSKFQNDDVLFPRITPCLENGKRGFVMTLEQNEIGIGSTEFIVFREKMLPSEFIYFLTCQEEFRKNAEISMVGASGRQRVQENCFSFFLVKAPPKKLLSAFTTIVRPIFVQIRNIFLQNGKLRISRDRLLSRLMSGKIDVENLDIQFPASMRCAEPVETQAEAVDA